jgi:hypothetical protein
MNAHNPYKNRRSNSQLLPRLYLVLQFVIILLSSYIGFIVLNAIGIPSEYTLFTIIFVDLYFLQTTFFKCRAISKRNNFAKQFVY